MPELIGCAVPLDRNSRGISTLLGMGFPQEFKSSKPPGAQEMLVRKVNPFLKKGIDQLSTAIRPKKAYKTNRKDLDGSGLLSNLAYGFNYAPWNLLKKEKESTFTKQSENFQNQKKDGHFPGITTLGLTTHWMNS